MTTLPRQPARSIPGCSTVSDDLSEENIVNEHRDDHIAQESIRQLRTNLRFVNVDTPLVRSRHLRGAR